MLKLNEFVVVGEYILWVGISGLHMVNGEITDHYILLLFFLFVVEDMK